MQHQSSMIEPRGYMRVMGMGMGKGGKEDGGDGLKMRKK